MLRRRGLGVKVLRVWGSRTARRVERLRGPIMGSYAYMYIYIYIYIRSLYMYIHQYIPYKRMDFVQIHNQIHVYVYTYIYIYISRKIRSTNKKINQEDTCTRDVQPFVRNSQS